MSTYDYYSIRRKLCCQYEYTLPSTCSLCLRLDISHSDERNPVSSPIRALGGILADLRDADLLLARSKEEEKKSRAPRVRKPFSLLYSLIYLKVLLRSLRDTYPQIITRTSEEKVLEYKNETRTGYLKAVVDAEA